MPKIDPRIFRAYDIRGKAETELSEEACALIGRTFGRELQMRYQKNTLSIVLGRDARTHSLKFEEAVLKGLLACGVHVLRIGETPSPVNYFTICSQETDGGIQVTASHNEAEDNGLKLETRGAEAFSGDDLQLLYKKIVQDEVSGSGRGTEEDFDASEPYLDHLAHMFGSACADLRIAIDCGNGVAGPVYTRALKASGCTLTELYTNPDGTFPNHLADPSRHETLTELRKTVVREGLRLGLAFDGDGDRLGVIDETGAIRSSDEILLLLAEDHLRRHPGAPVIFTVSNSSVLESEIRRLGGKPVMCKVGHSFVEHEMRKMGAHLGGEQSGHFFCGEDYYGFDDALVAAMRILKIVAESEAPASSLFKAFPKVFQARERRPMCPDAKKPEIVNSVIAHFKRSYPVNDLDGARIDFGGGAWAGIRQSNTSPRLSICIEARSEEKLKEIEEIVLEHLKKYPEIRFET